jgi:preprotein translocase subunit YajC
MEKAKPKMKSVAKVAPSKEEVANDLVTLHLQKKEIEKQEKELKEILMKKMEVGDKILAKGCIVSRVKSETPIVSVSAAKDVLGPKDIMEVVKVSVTELKKFMGENEIFNIAETTTIKDYISVKEK